MNKKLKQIPDMEVSSGNVFADLDLDMELSDAENLKIKSGLMIESIKRSKAQTPKTDAEIAKLLGVPLFALKDMEQVHALGANNKLFGLSARGMTIAERAASEAREKVCGIAGMGTTQADFAKIAGIGMTQADFAKIAGIGMTQADVEKLIKPLSEYTHLKSFLASSIGSFDYFDEYENRRKKELEKAVLLAGESISDRIKKETIQNLTTSFSTLFAPIQDQPALKPYFLGIELHRAIDEDDDDEIQRIMDDPAFCVAAIKAMHEAAKMTSEDVDSVLNDAKKINEKNAELARKVRFGYQLRQDTIDKNKLTEYFEQKNHTVKNRAEIEHWEFNDWPITTNYTIDFYVDCYKAAMPHVKFVGGRPKKSNKTNK